MNTKTKYTINALILISLCFVAGRTHAIEITADVASKCNFVSELAQKIALRRDAGIDKHNTLLNLKRLYAHNDKTFELVTFYVNTLYSNSKLDQQNIRNAVLHQCTVQLMQLHGLSEF